MPTKTSAEATTCTCGCGESTAGGRFRPGHDTRLKSRLVAAYRSTKGLTKDEKALVDRLGWTQYMTAAPAAPKAKKDDTSDGNGATKPALPTKNELTPGQITMLRALAAAGPDGLTRQQLKDAVGSGTGLSKDLGPLDADEVAEAAAKAGRGSLLSLGLVSIRQEDQAGKTVVLYRILAKGKRAVAKTS